MILAALLIAVGTLSIIVLVSRYDALDYGVADHDDAIPVQLLAAGLLCDPELPSSDGYPLSAAGLSALVDRTERLAACSSPGVGRVLRIEGALDLEAFIDELSKHYQARVIAARPPVTPTCKKGTASPETLHACRDLDVLSANFWVGESAGKHVR